MALKPEILTGINPKDFFKNEKHIIIYSFSIGDRHYFRFDDPLNMPYDRALKCLVYWKELDMNCDRPLLKAHTEAFDNIFSRNLQSKSISLNDLLQLKQLNDQLKQRLELPKETELMYKMASVVFFDQHENPQTYEFKYGIQKIKNWRRNTTLTDFFLQMPLQELIPYLTFAGENLLQFSEMTDRAKTQHLDNLLPLLSEKQRTTLQST